MVRFHSAEAWLITASICSCRLLLGAVRLRFTWEFLSVMVSMTPGGGDCFVDAPLFLFARNLADLQILSKNLQYCVPACPTLRGSLLQRHQREFSSSLCRRFVVPNPVGERFNCPHCSGLLELFAAFPPSLPLIDLSGDEKCSWEWEADGDVFLPSESRVFT